MDATFIIKAQNMTPDEYEMLVETFNLLTGDLSAPEKPVWIDEVIEE